MNIFQSGITLPTRSSPGPVSTGPACAYYVFTATPLPEACTLPLYTAARPLLTVVLEIPVQEPLGFHITFLPHSLFWHPHIARRPWPWWRWFLQQPLSQMMQVICVTSSSAKGHCHEISRVLYDSAMIVPQEAVIEVWGMQLAAKACALPTRQSRQRGREAAAQLPAPPAGGALPYSRAPPMQSPMKRLASGRCGSTGCHGQHNSETRRWTTPGACTSIGTHRPGRPKLLRIPTSPTTLWGLRVRQDREQAQGGVNLGRSAGGRWGGSS